MKDGKKYSISGITRQLVDCIFQLGALLRHKHVSLEAKSYMKHNIKTSKIDKYDNYNNNKNIIKLQNRNIPYCSYIR